APRPFHLTLSLHDALPIFLGSNEPLYVIDGFPFSGNPTFLQNADIESIEILKDASSVAIYGSRGANGVVMITTKSGKKGGRTNRSEEHTSELQSRENLVCR